MPELPEVETTRLAISPYLLDETIDKLVTRHQQLRLPVSPDLQFSVGQKIRAIERRAKYLLLHLSKGCLLIHLGMSGHLRIANKGALAGKHDHIDLQLVNGLILRYQDPRRFGLWLYLTQNPLEHPLLSHLGVEPLDDTFNGSYVFNRAHKKTQSIKSFIMNNEVVVGVGNIYATESLFLAGIHPETPAGSISYERFEILISYIKKVLRQAITAGGTTLKDFYALDGKPGYFANELLVYGRKNQPCFRCDTLIEIVRIAGRSSAFCPGCQILA
ncbi:MAG: bifunctional DNA-formamidopyrimidine glycosylase/DNA-(apurinic or apyrimidinic site) lyase [Legionella sp.]|nr:bifunctional DNA-formamidopyrimidine glycosylase/DNA-(apurinic or apyrimidinic site) lyase [Legionella sp.]